MKSARLYLGVLKGEINMNTFKSFLAIVLCIAIPFTVFAGEVATSYL